MYSKGYERIEERQEKGKYGIKHSFVSKLVMMNLENKFCLKGWTVDSTAVSL